MKPRFKLVKYLESKLHVPDDFWKDLTGKAVSYCLSTTGDVLKGLTVSKQLYGMVYAVSGCKCRYGFKYFFHNLPEICFGYIVFTAIKKIKTTLDATF